MRLREYTSLEAVSAGFRYVPCWFGLLEAECLDGGKAQTEPWHCRRLLRAGHTANGPHDRNGFRYERRSAEVSGDGADCLIPSQTCREADETGHGTMQLA